MNRQFCIYKDVNHKTIYKYVNMVKNYQPKRFLSLSKTNATHFLFFS